MDRTPNEAAVDKAARKARAEGLQKSLTTMALDRETAPFFVLWRPSVPNSPMVKEGIFFRNQGGLTEAWGEAWEAIDALSVGDARRKIAARNGVSLSHIYEGEE